MSSDTSGLMRAPFRVYKRGDVWFLRNIIAQSTIVGFDSAGDAIDHAYRNWPWWP